MDLTKYIFMGYFPHATIPWNVHMHTHTYVLYICMCIKQCKYIVDMYIHTLYIHISLGTLVPNSRDRHEKQWRPDFTHHKTHPKMRFVCEKQTEVHF